MNQQIESDTKHAQGSDRITLYKVKEFSDRTGISYRLVLAAIASGELRCVKAGKRWFRIRSEDGAKWIVSLTKTHI
jgi:excisionase family DNA binding protein